MKVDKTVVFTIVIVLVTVAALLLLPGCGSNEPPATRAERDLQARPVDLLMPDCSPSFYGNLDVFTGTFEKVVLDSAARGRTLWHGCFDGSPLRTLTWNPKVDFGELPESVMTSEQLASRFNQARAIGTVKKIEQTIAAAKNQVAGSGQLEALEVAAKTPKTGRVFMVTDLISFEADGVTLATATEALITDTVKLWLPRLGDGFRGVQVFIIGYGLDAGSSKAARNAVSLFTRLITKAGGEVSITKDLPADLVIEELGS